MHSGIASHALQQCLPQPDAVVCIWQSDASMNVKAYSVPACPVIDVAIGGWRVCTDEVFAKNVRKFRKAKLPRETGGVLLGNFDQENRIVYLVDVLPSPPDSEEWPTLYIRGNQGLENAVDRVRERTNNQLQYIGEWHSHPNGYSTEASRDDRKVFGWLSEQAARDSNPPVMVIGGEKNIRIFVGSIDDWALVKREK
jgi:integrative and conjugative element protein (TIGR02256 family)